MLGGRPPKRIDREESKRKVKNALCLTQTRSLLCMRIDHQTTRYALKSGREFLTEGVCDRKKRMWWQSCLGPEAKEELRDAETQLLREDYKMRTYNHIKRRKEKTLNQHPGIRRMRR